MVRKKDILLIVFMIYLLFLPLGNAIMNPAEVYCSELGYKTKINITPEGEQGICVIEENVTEFDEWEFFQGKVGGEYSYCAKLGYDVETLDDGRNPYSPEYAICVIGNHKLMDANDSDFKKNIAVVNQKVPVIDLMNLQEKVSTDTKNQVSGFTIAKTTDKEDTYSLIKTASQVSSFDWRNYNGYNWLTPVKHQRCGNCWAYSAVGATESKIKIVRNDPHFSIDLSEQDLVSCSDAGSCRGGWHHLALSHIKDHGITDELCFPDSGSDEPCSNKCFGGNKRLWTIDNVMHFDSLSDEDIKSYLVEKGPLAVGLMMDGYFDQNNIYRCENPTSGAHAVVIVGYDDIGGYWIIKNSWGTTTTYGENGYFKVGYGECLVGNFVMAYIDLHKLQYDNVYVNTIYAATGDQYGDIEDIKDNDNEFMVLSEDCDFFGCDGLDVGFDFSLQGLTDVSSLDIVVNHRARWDEDFKLEYWDISSSSWKHIEFLPDSRWYILKYNLCDSKSECLNFINSNNNFLVRYYHPSCTFCDTDYVDIDILNIEATTDVGGEYCPAYTDNSNEEYIVRVELNNNAFLSDNSTYSDFTSIILTNLNRGSNYTLNVSGHTISSFQEYVMAWIDFNNDKTFSNDEEIVLGSQMFSGDYTFSKMFTVPNDANLSEVRMRIYLKWGSEPSSCEISSYGEVEDYRVKIVEDTNPPIISVQDYGVGYIETGSQVVISASVYDVSDVSSVYADIESSDGSVIARIELYDDGLHGDNYANDDVYGNIWTTNVQPKDYYIDFTGTDVYGNTMVYDNLDKFTTIPFSHVSEILLVDDSMYTPYVDYYRDALDYNSYSFDVWDFELRGTIGNDIMDLFYLCIWSSPGYKVPNSEQQSVLVQYLNNGGNLFISGQDIGYYINDTTFYNDYLHANYIEDNSDLYVLNGVKDDLITHGITIQITGDGGANNQWWPSEIDAITPAVPIFLYDNSSIFQTESQELPENYKDILSKKNVESIGPTGISSSGTGALRVDTDIYKVVYFAFGFEAINNESVRSSLMKNIVDYMFSCIPNWVEVNTTCQVNNVKIGYFIDTNDCNETETKPDDNTYVCDYCAPNWTCLSYGECLSHDMQYCNATLDQNTCYEQTNLSSDLFVGNPSELGNQTCDYCVPNWYEVNTTCQIDDVKIGYFVDDNNCYAITNLEADNVPPESNVYPCDRCVPHWNCNRYSECTVNDIQHCNSVEDLNDCYNTTSLPSDLYGGDYSEFTPIVCDYCAPNWTCSSYAECLPDDARYCNGTLDLNGCYGQTNLSSDLYYGNLSEFESHTCDYCAPDWIVNYTWSICADSIQFKNYYDTNGCYAKTNLTLDLEGKPDNLNRTCELIPPQVTINEPKAMNYTSMHLTLNVSTDETANCAYVLNDVTGAMLFTDSKNGAKTVTAKMGANIINISCIDGYGNINDTEYVLFNVIKATYESNTNIINTEPSIVNASMVDTLLEISTNSNFTNSSINITRTLANPTNASFGVTEIGKYIQIEADADLLNNLTFALIKIFYTDEEIEGLDENSLAVYWYNESPLLWIELDETMDWVYGTGVNTTANYAWANVSHFSTYGVGGQKQDGESCSSTSECAGGYCVHGICRTSSTYCGDSYCDSGETCSSCEIDCGSCYTSSSGGGSSGIVPQKKEENVTEAAEDEIVEIEEVKEEEPSKETKDEKPPEDIQKEEEIDITGEKEAEIVTSSTTPTGGVLRYLTNPMIAGLLVVIVLIVYFAGLKSKKARK